MPAADATPGNEDVIELERALTRISHLLTRARRHERAVTEAGVSVDRASVPIMRLLSDAPEPMRMGELAIHLGCEAPHVTRQIQRLERSGFVERIADPNDRRAQFVRLTLAGREATDAIRAVGRRWMAEALSHWSPEDRRLLATLNHRMVDDFLGHAESIPACGLDDRA